MSTLHVIKSPNFRWKSIKIANADIDEKCCKIHENNLCNFFIKKSKCLYSGLSNIFDNLEYFGMAAFSNGIIDYGSLCRCT